MKRILSLFLALVLALSLAGCGGGTASPANSGYTVEALWDALAGAWLTENVPGGTFACFAKGDDGALVFSCGIVCSDGANWGTPLAVNSISPTLLALTVEYPPVPANELHDEWAGATLTHTLDISRLDEHIITMDTLFNQDPTAFTRGGDTLEGAIASMPAPPFSGPDLWARLAGVWVCETDDQGIGFVLFLSEGDKCLYSSGLMFSGAVSRGTVVAFSLVSDGIAAVTVSYEGMPATMENSGYDPFMKTYTLNYGSMDGGTVTTDDLYLAGSNTYTYCAPTLAEASTIITP